jgi:DNA-directed RNA polymerase subunit H (RpoH/RPB5)
MPKITKTTTTTTTIKPKSLLKVKSVKPVLDETQKALLKQQKKEERKKAKEEALQAKKIAALSTALLTNDTDQKMDNKERDRDRDREKDNDVDLIMTKRRKVSASLLKTRMSSAGLQNPISRKKIWGNLVIMMRRQGYRPIQHAKPPTDIQELLPNNKGVLGELHMHFIDERLFDRDVINNNQKEKEKEKEKETVCWREPVYVVLASKAGEPTLKSLTFRSQHLILITDSLTGRAQGVLQELSVQLPPVHKTAELARLQEKRSLERFYADHNDRGEADHEKKTKKEKDMEALLQNISAGNSINTTSSSSLSSSSSSLVITNNNNNNTNNNKTHKLPPLLLNEVYVEAFESSTFLFDLPEQRYLNVTQFSKASDAEIKKVCEIFKTPRGHKDFPQMLDTDPVARYYRLTQNEVLKQTRLSSTAGQDISYRAIISA